MRFPPRAAAMVFALYAAGALAGDMAGAPPEPALPFASPSELAPLVERYSVDLGALLRRYPSESSPERLDRMDRFHREWQERFDKVPFEPLGVEGRIDHLLLRRLQGRERALIDRRRATLREVAARLPFHERVHALNDARLRMETIDTARAAGTLEALATEIDALRKRSESADAPPGGPRSTSRDAQRAAFQAQEGIADLKQVLAAWYEFYAGYDPVFTWWAAAPYKRVAQALDEYRTFLRDKVLGIRPGQDDPVVGAPVGRAALERALAAEMIAYSPDELLRIADREFAWCEAEMKKAARDMGLGDDVKAALEKVKADHVEPGRQPDLIRDLAREAEEYLERHGLITVPPLAKEVWRMRMMTPERQKVNPFFTGGEVISVSFPTDTMAHEDKLMSLRGNNVHFARATVFHELIPGHHLQAFMNARYNAHRMAFRTPFWGEGWALYWEMLLWDRGFAKSPENRVGMLFWRMHRAARIMFSLRFHLGEWTPQQSVDFLVEKVGHERANAEAEVRRSFNGSYAPLYQLAYMVGGLQFRALHRELVESGKMTDREFHDHVLTGGPMPVEMVRARLLKQELARDHAPTWK